MTEWYFAYGSNLWIDQVIARTGPIRLGAVGPQVVRLANHRLVFNMRSPRSADPDTVYANIEPAESEVLGVVYGFDAEALRKMDVFEAGYRRQRVTVEVVATGERLEAIVYIAEPANVAYGHRPDDAYVQRIVRGASQHGLPEDYIEQIQALAATVAATKSHLPRLPSEASGRDTRREHCE